jgi:phosphatidylserine decarboxylase
MSVKTLKNCISTRYNKINYRLIIDMKDIYYCDRKSNTIVKEKVYGLACLTFLYGKGRIAKIILSIIAKLPYFSRVFAAFQKTKFSKHKIQSFIKKYDIDKSEFLDDISSFTSFNDFFIRKLKKDKRPIVQDKKIAILPADARYMVVPNISSSEGFYVKEKKFGLEGFLQNKSLAKRYNFGSMVIARLNPTDYHRFHFPFDCIADKTDLINGYLYSVNPIALKKNINIFSENKRMITSLSSDVFGIVLMIEVGATNVGSITQTFSPNKKHKKGGEKGYFSFGGSSIIMLFEPGRIIFDNDIIDNSEKMIETKALFGQTLGKGC